MSLRRGFRPADGLTQWSENRWWMHIERVQGRCRYCNWDLREVHIERDHVHPVLAGGRLGDDDCNITLVCKQCNRAKSDRVFITEADWAVFLMEMMQSHGCLSEGWPEGAEDWWRSILAQGGVA